MGFEQQDIPLKLSLFSLPNQTPELAGMPTPPLRTLASVPFDWEEAPGKPRSPTNRTTGLPPKPKAARTLDLPPRLAKITQTPSPTAVLDGPYMSRKLPRAMSFSLHRGPIRSFWGSEKGLADEEKIRNKCDQRGRRSLEESSGEWRGISDFSHSVSGRSTRSESDFLKRKITRFRKRGSFFGSTKSHTWMNIYESVKHAVHWKRNN